jgi:hypothetical protein
MLLSPPYCDGCHKQIVRLDIGRDAHGGDGDGEVFVEGLLGFWS